MEAARNPIEQETLMPYKRRADKHTDTPITPQMIAVFDKLRRARSEQQYDDLHGELWGAYQAELRARTGRTRPWEWPICVDPRYDENPYPHGTWPHANWQPNERARAMWRQLEQ